MLSNAAQLAWERILKNEDDAQDLREIFPELRTLPSFDFSELHKTVLAILPLDIDTVLLKQNWRVQANLKDTWGRTPLHWAVLREDERATRALIISGASLEIGDYEGNRPIHYAAGCSRIECLATILSAGANPRIQNANGAEPLLFACWQTLEHMQALMQAGAPVTVKDNRGSSTVEWACWCNKHTIGEYLIQMGADNNHADRLNGNPRYFRHSQAKRMNV
jgi:ankyrin repeat protein